MNTKRANSRRHSTSPQLSRQWWAAPAVFLVTLLALPVNATIIGIPDVPLTTGSRVAPNILFILDNSGSMARTYMPDAVPATSAPDISDLAYPRNTLSYNPAVTYQPWVQANGSRMTAGTTYTSVYDHLQLTSGSLNLGNRAQAFFVPQNTVNPTVADLGNGTKYYLYKIVQGGTDVVRSGTYGAVTKSGGVARTITPTPAKLINNNTVTHSLATVTSGLKLEITITSTNNRGKDFWVKDPSLNTVCSGSVDNAASYVCAIDSTAAGVYKVEVKRNENNDATYTLTANTYSSSNRCGLGTETGGTATQDWINCASALPNAAARNTVAKELTNYATWYSYYRTRMKAAKAGAAEAFKSVGYKSRVGFRTISQDNSGNPIPVNTFDGRFGDNPATATIDEGINRTNWYTTLFAAQGSGYTPLRSALNYAGQYFKGTGSAGAYGPQLGTSLDPQYSCRQNFTILTTDGYWNTDSETGNPGSIGNADAGSPSTITGPNGQSYTYTAAAPYTDSYSTTLADIAMHYWKTDLRDAASFNKTGNLDNNVSTSTGDPAFWQHMVTFGISIGLAGNKGWDSISNVPANATWADPTDTEDADRIDDLLHAALNGHGAFVAATDPAKFSAGLRAALAAIDQRTSSYSNVATNSVSLDTGAQVFNASYTAGFWTGTLYARAVSESGVSSSISWTASIPTSSRNVWTSQSGSLVAFETSSKAATLSRAGATELYPVSATVNAAYIKGDRTNEESNGGTLRNRNSLLGDIVGSSPAFVKGGASGDGSAKGTLYVGANDGMLHAFNAEDGKELFAYIPNIIDWDALNSYSSGEYSHRFFVDGPVVVSSKSLTASKNILVGTLGKGGTGLYALDVTDPAAPAFKWEMKDTVAPSAGFMGKVLGKPVLGNVMGSPSAILGNGVDSVSNQAALIIVKGIDTASPTTVVVQAGSDGTAASPNALFAPTAVLGKDGKTVATVYAGDMLGNLWKFDLTTATPTVKKLFAAGSSKRITGGVTVAVHPTTNKRWVFFGTGRFLIDTDLANTATQSMYGIIDEDVLLADSDLDVQDAPVVSGDKRSFQSKTALITGKKGWRVDLPISGERIVQDMQVVSTFLLSASMIPSGDACGADGRGYINALDAFTGTSAGGSYFDVPGEDTIDGSVGGIPIGSVDVGNGMPTLPNLLRGLLVVGGTGGSELRSLKTLTPRWDRVSWREVRTD